MQVLYVSNLACFPLTYTKKERENRNNVRPWTLICNSEEKQERQEKIERNQNKQKQICLEAWNEKQNGSAPWILVSSLSATLMLLFCSSFFTSHSHSCLLPRFALLPSQARAGLCLVSCVLQKQTDAVPKPLCSTYSHEAKYLQGTVRQRLQPVK